MMSETNWQLRSNIATGRAHRGQALVVALAVLFVMLAIGGLFVTRIAQNLTIAGRSREDQDARYLAEAGIQYCDDALTNSPEGADWRPEPEIAKGPVSPSDPDYRWLQQGFARVNRKGGRFLVRVVYDPQPNDPRSYYLRIESIGRVGEIAMNGGPVDPTVYVQNGTQRQRVERIAYKQIGLTDYLRFVTNIDRRGTENFLGTPAIGQDVASVFGDPTIATRPDGQNGGNLLFGSSVRVNGNLRIGGDAYFYFSQRGNSDATLSPEGLFVSGDIALAPNRNPSDLNASVNQVINAAVGANPNYLIRPSGDPNFTTVAGLVRDGRDGSDPNGYTRRIPYLAPPVMDGYAAGSGTLRYRVLTREAGRFTTADFNTGQYGWGSGIYVNNTADLQKETTTPGMTGSYSLRAEWLNPKAGYGQGYWDGPFYRPPGVRIKLMGNFIRLTRNDGKRFYYPDGSPVTQHGGKVLDIPLADVDRLNYRIPDGPSQGQPFPLPPFPHDGDDPVPGNPSYGVNVVIMTEGNALISGVYGTTADGTGDAESFDPNNPDNTVRKLSRVHLTIVSGGTAYIEGNVLKGDPDRASTCAILARDYVALNTTMFMAPQSQINVWSPYLNGVQIGLARPAFETAFSFGLDPAQSYGPNEAVYMLLRHAAMSPGPALVNLLVNPALSGTPEYLFTLGNGEQSPHYPIGLKFFNGVFVPDQLGVLPLFEQRGFRLSGNDVGSFTAVTTPGFENLLRYQMGQTGPGTLFGNSGATDYVYGGAMITPLDIRIEALLYAQQRSFFIIPRPSDYLNADPNDTRANYTLTGQRPSFSQYDTPEERRMKSMFPFYGEPVSGVRITIFGAIAENYTASMGDQAAWMKQVGYFPITHGASNISVPDLQIRAQDPAGYSPGTDQGQDFRTPYEIGSGITRGLRFLYDPAFALPYRNPTSVAARGPALRRQNFGVGVNGAQLVSLTLPPIPRLPVCPGLLYFGEPERRIEQ